jgi:hypothetical protein
MVTPRSVARNEGGWRVGDSHHNAIVPDAVVHELRDLFEHKGLRCRQLIELFAERGIVLRYRWLRKVVAYQTRPDPKPNP